MRLTHHHRIVRFEDHMMLCEVFYLDGEPWMYLKPAEFGCVLNANGKDEIVKAVHQAFIEADQYSVIDHTAFKDKLHESSESSAAADSV